MDALHRHWRSVLLLIALVLAGAWLLTRGVALALQARHPALALRWHPANPEALARINEHEADLLEKAARARVVLARRPRDGRAYRHLGEVAEKTGDIAAARRLHAVAARYTPRDRLAHAWLADDALRSGEPAVALVHLDAILVADPLLRAPLQGPMLQLAQEPLFFDTLLKTLATRPLWREEFIRAWTEAPGDTARLQTAVARLASLGAPLTGPERRAWVDRLLREGRHVQARRAWLTPADTPSSEALLLNGDFSEPPAGPFDWQVKPVAEGDVLLVADGQGNPGLRVEFFGHRAAFAGPSQVLVLPVAAHYRFSVRSRIETARLDGDGKLSWSVRCVASPAEPLATVPVGATGSSQLVLDFFVPPGCPAQSVALELVPLGLAQRMTGVAWFDDATVRALGRPGRTSVDIVAAKGFPPPVVGVRSKGRRPFSDVVRDALGVHRNAAGNLDPDVPVGP